MVKTLRKDAAARRMALLKAAKAVFAEKGMDAPLDLVAERAGVGRATLYRNFPDRAALALAVLEDEMAELAERLEQTPVDERAFFRFLDEVAEVVQRNAALSGWLRGIYSHGVLEPLRHRLARLGEDPLRRAQAAGLIRKDLEPEDLRLLLIMLGGVAQGVSAAERASLERSALDLLLRGLLVRA